MKKNQIKTLAKFVGLKANAKQITDWNFLMLVVEKIENIIEHCIDIKTQISISWWYSPKNPVLLNGELAAAIRLKERHSNQFSGSFIKYINTINRAWCTK